MILALTVTKTLEAHSFFSPSNSLHVNTCFYNSSSARHFCLTSCTTKTWRNQPSLNIPRATCSVQVCYAQVTSTIAVTLSSGNVRNITSIKSPWLNSQFAHYARVIDVPFSPGNKSLIWKELEEGKEELQLLQEQNCKDALKSYPRLHISNKNLSRKAFTGSYYLAQLHFLNL